MKTYLIVHFAGFLASVLAQVILVSLLRFYSRPMIRYFARMNDHLREFGLYYDIHKDILISARYGTTCKAHSGLSPPKFIETALIVQSLFLSWINLILIGVGLIATVSMGRDMATSFESNLNTEDNLSDPKFLKSELIQLASSNLSNDVSSFVVRGNIERFVDDHIP